MSPKTLDTEIVFRDLTRANKKLRHQHKNPDAVRRRLTDFVVLSQKLTATMRKEFESLTGQKWEPKRFAGWDGVTELFKQLRNLDAHELPIRIVITQFQEFDGYSITEDASGNETRTPTTRTVGMEFNPEAGLKKELPNPFGVAGLDQNGDPIAMLSPDETYFEFNLEGRTSEIEALIDRAGTRNCHVLAAKCYSTLSEYYRFYRSELNARSEPAEKRC